MGSFFAITGKPRIRSAWLSTYFSVVPGSYCLHDLLARTDCSWESVSCLLEAAREDQPGEIGLADSALLFHPAVLKHAERILLVQRPPMEVARWFLEVLRVDPHRARLLLQRLEMREMVVAEDPRVLAVPFGELDERAEEIHSHLLPGVPFRPAVWEEMAQRHIEVPTEKLLGRVTPEAAQAALEVLCAA